MALRCLVVEDDRILRNTIAQCAAKYIDCVDHAATGEEALRKIKLTKLDILVSDWDLGSGIDGVQLAGHTLKIHPAVKIIFTTGKSNMKLRMAAASINDYELLPKPFGLAVFQSALTRVLDDIEQ